ncbi:variable surface lipoprotein [Mycoplasmopsis felis]|uniref:variable surface lipoprotein n=1 Tax=Mycoplasmopsis felis TaxID=33923 RepID=UPI0021AF7ADA|nr:variable surface lipoprotein [Mycoplasmopsis felis]MCU9937244.1 variable surface lipoprotein [Mycoplasmopsis felis]UWV78877.1 variable surface lipoprotein [Mycoplasmopsis felis]
MKLKKIKYLFLLSSSITIIPAIAMSCDKNEEPGNNTGTTDKQVTPPIKFLHQVMVVKIAKHLTMIILQFMQMKT